MTDRIQDDDSLIPPGGDPSGFIRNPIIVVYKTDDGGVRYLISFGDINENMDDPRVAGVLLSDLLDHIAAAYQATTGRDQRDLRAAISKVMRDEDRFKEKDPSRGAARGATIWPRKQ
jgi:hypothetical protein